MISERLLNTAKQPSIDDEGLYINDYGLQHQVHDKFLSVLITHFLDYINLHISYTKSTEISLANEISVIFVELMCKLI